KDCNSAPGGVVTSIISMSFPSLRLTLTVNVFHTSTTTDDKSAIENPGATTVSEYIPDATCAKLNSQRESDEDLRPAPVPESRSPIVGPGTTEPDGSVICPSTCPVVSVCAFAGRACTKAQSNTRAQRNLPDAVCVLKVIIASSPLRLAGSNQ